jgi:MFS family permease
MAHVLPPDRRPGEPNPAAATPRGHRALSRNVVVLSWVSFFQDAASEMLYPVIPLFLTTVLGAPVAVVGLIEGVAEGTASVMKAVSGRLADFRRRKPLVAAGYGISSVAKLLIGLATGWPLVLAARFIDRFGKGVRTSPRDALIVADTPLHLRGRAFGFHRAMDTAGAVLGPLMGLGLYEALSHRLRPLFFVAFIPAAVSVALVGFVRERSPAPSGGGSGGSRGRARELPPRYWKVVGLLTLFGLVNFTDALIILRAKRLGLSFVAVILAYVLYNTTYAAISYPAGTLSDRFPRRLVFAAGLGVFAVAYTGLGLAGTAMWVWILLPVYGAYTAMTDGVGKAWVSDLLPAERVGSGLGLYQGLAGGASLLAGVWAGLAWGGTGRTPFVVSGVIAGALAILLAVTGRWTGRPSWEPVREDGSGAAVSG